MTISFLSACIKDVEVVYLDVYFSNTTYGNYVERALHNETICIVPLT